MSCDRPRLLSNTLATLITPNQKSKTVNAHSRFTIFHQFLIFVAITQYMHPLLTGCGRLTAVSSPITVRASGSRFGSWMTDAMIPSSDSRVGGLCVPVFVRQEKQLL